MTSESSWHKRLVKVERKAENKEGLSYFFHCLKINLEAGKKSERKASDYSYSA
jgi:hypothetical protein